MGTTSTAGPTGWGVGAEAMLLGGPAGAAIVYDMGDMHVDGILSMAAGDNTQLGLGGRLLWVLHRSSAADFSLGGGLGVLHNDRNGNNDSVTDFHVEAIGQIRAFITQNVALSTTLGFGVNLNDGRDDSFAFGGQFLTSAGLVYFFQ